MLDHCVFTFYFDYKFEMDRMLRSLYYFHPDITVEAWDRSQMESLPGFNYAYGYPRMSKFLSDKYKYLTHIDADVLVVDRIDELFNTNYDVIAGRNNSDNNMAGRDKGFTLPGLDPLKYVNAGIFTINSKEFVEDWYNSSMDHGHKVQFGEQGTLNELFHSGKYKSLLLDPVEKQELWGTSFQYGTRTMWDSWKQIRVRNGKLYLGNKIVKMMHIAGGGKKPPLRDLVLPEVCDYIRSITGVI